MKNLTDSTFDKYREDTMPLLVMFRADFAGPCRLAMPEFEGAASRIGNRIRCVTFDLDGNPDVPERYGVRSIPLFVLFEEGVPVKAVAGALNESQILGEFDGE